MFCYLIGQNRQRLVQIWEYFISISREKSGRTNIPLCVFFLCANLAKATQSFVRGDEEYDNWFGLNTKFVEFYFSSERIWVRIKPQASCVIFFVKKRKA